MKISRLIKELKETLREYGDVDVVLAVDTEDSTEDDPIVNEYDIDNELCIGYDGVKDEYVLVIQAERSL